MHYRDLYIAHKAFYWAEPRAYYYDWYMKRKNWEKWTSSVPLDEVEKLFDFIRHWDFHFGGDAEKFSKIYEEISVVIEGLEKEKLENVNFDDDSLCEAIEKVFDKIADCSWKYESTDSSKILHTLIPNLSVMWDRKIRKGILGGEERNWGAVYATEFLPKMQNDVKEALTTCMQEKNFSPNKAIEFICQLCDGKTLPKLLDEYNYMVFTRPEDFLAYIKNSKDEEKITPEDCDRLSRKISF
jgi:hypothetical protein